MDNGKRGEDGLSWIYFKGTGVRLCQWIWCWVDEIKEWKIAAPYPEMVLSLTGFTATHQIQATMTYYWKLYNSKYPPDQSIFIHSSNLSESFYIAKCDFNKKSGWIMLCLVLSSDFYLAYHKNPKEAFEPLPSVFTHSTRHMSHHSLLYSAQQLHCLYPYSVLSSSCICCLLCLGFIIPSQIKDL